MYYYKVYYETTLLRDSADMDEYFEDEDEAKEEAEGFVEEKIKQWKLDGAWHDSDSEDDFDIVVDYEDDEETEYDRHFREFYNYDI